MALFGAAWHAALPHRDRPAKVSAAVGAALGLLAAEPGYARLLLVDAPSAGRAGQPVIDDALQAFARLLTRATAGPDEQQPKLLPLAMAAGIAELAAGWVLDGRTAQLPALQAPLVELILTPALGLTAAARAADAATRTTPAGAGIDDRRRLMDAVAVTAQREGLEAAALSDVAQRAGVELDVAHTLFTDELDVAVQALDAWAGQLVVVAAGAFLGAAGDPPLAAHQALQAAVSHIARTPALAALAVSDDPDAGPGRRRVARPLHRPVLLADRRPGAGDRAARAAALRHAGDRPRRHPGRPAPLRPRGPHRRADPPSCRRSAARF